NYIRVDDPHPVNRKTIILVQVMRVDPPPVIVAARPSGCVKPEVIRSPRLRLYIKAILVGRLEIHSGESRALRHIYASLRNKIKGVSIRCPACLIGSHKSAEYRQTGGIQSVARNDIQPLRIARRRASEVTE